jgi:hypothetical protein
MLIDKLQGWLGRQSTQEAIEKRGFTEHLIYQEVIKSYCEKLPEAEDIVHYWDEVAKEYVLCGGMADSIKRSFKGEVRYRSSYLDELSDRSVGKPATRVNLLHPGATAFHWYWSESKALGLEMASKIEVAKLLTSHELWKDFPEFESEARLIEQALVTGAHDLGFTVHSKRSASFACHGLIFNVRLDRMSGDMIQIPIYISVWDDEDPS